MRLNNGLIKKTRTKGARRNHYFFPDAVILILPTILNFFKVAVVTQTADAAATATPGLCCLSNYKPCLLRWGDCLASRLGLYRNKAKFFKMPTVTRWFFDTSSSKREELESRSGAGRKTANVVMRKIGSSFGGYHVERIEAPSILSKKSATLWGESGSRYLTTWAVVSVHQAKIISKSHHIQKSRVHHTHSYMTAL